LAGGCYRTRPSSGGGQVVGAGARDVNAADVWLPSDYRIEPVFQGLTFPTGVTFDDDGNVYVVESGYAYGEEWTHPRLLQLYGRGAAKVIARGHNGPWNGVTYRDGFFYVAEGGEAQGGRILKIDRGGNFTPLVANLPSMGDHHTNGPVVSQDGYVYFGQGTATNSGVVGPDNAQYGWLKRFPDFHDIPGQDVTLTGLNYESRNALVKQPHRNFFERLFPFVGPRPRTVLTGAYQPYGTPTRKGQVVRGQVPCTGAIMRVSVNGGEPELVAWGLRNPFGLALTPDGRLFATENQFDVRGSRPVWGTGDLLWEIRSGMWYGWPDFFAGQPINNPDRFGSSDSPTPRRLLAQYPNRPPKPAAIFGVHSSADGFDFSHSPAFGHAGDAFVAEFGDLAPSTGKVLAPVGFRVVRVELNGGIVHPFAVNRGDQDGPASKLGTGGLERPIAARFNPSGDSLYVVDFGVMTTDARGKTHPLENTGVLWRISREAR
jgi:glucose/arabinose dehydrogenase